MAFDYSKLRGKIVEKYGNQGEFAKAMNWSERTLSNKMKGKIAWKQTDILSAVGLLGLSENDIQDYFFTMKVQNV